MSNSARVININIAFLNVEATDAIKQYATDKVNNCQLGGWVYVGVGVG